MGEEQLCLPEGIILNKRYTIKESLGIGGFGITYQAYDALEHHTCAVKEYCPMNVSVRTKDGRIAPASEVWKKEFEHGKQRFTEEAQTLRKLNGNKNIVQIIDYFDENGTSYFVMEYIEGVNLQELKNAMGGMIPCQNVLNIVMALCDCLEQIHNQVGFLHRDISPENIMLTQDEEVKLIDFGNARNLSLQKGFSVVLKQGFAPPEQYSSSVGIQGAYTDVYSLASTMYYLLTGMMIPSALDRTNGDEYVPLEQMGFSKEISQAVDHALMLNYHERTQTMAEFKRELGEVETSSSVVEAEYKPYIKVIKGVKRGEIHEISKDEMVTLGRSEHQADICVDKNEKLSRVHCGVLYQSLDNTFTIEDFSLNGTYIDGNCIEKGNTVSVDIGTQIVLGNHICEIEVGVRNE
jgi:serine/threonine protein kinase